LNEARHRSCSNNAVAIARPCQRRRRRAGITAARYAEGSGWGALATHEGDLVDKAGGGRPPKNRSEETSGLDKPKTLEQLGISKQQSLGQVSERLTPILLPRKNVQK
jgi:hypothetical protein